MAGYSKRRYYSNSNGNSQGNSHRKYNNNSSTFSKPEKFAYHLARVQTGLQNPNSKVSASYKAGQDSIEFKQQKPLF